MLAASGYTGGTHVARCIAFAAVAALAAAVAGGPSPAQAQIVASRIATGLTFPMYATGPPGDDRVFIALRGGTIRVVDDGAVLATPFLDITSQVEFNPGVDEGGLLGMVFAPDYATTGVFYVYYTRERSCVPPEQAPCLTSVVSRFTVNGSPATSNDANEASETPILELVQPFNNHNGGTLAIRDGWLYLGLGDGGGSGDPQDRAQNDASPFGKMLRLDLSTPSPDLSDWEIWAKGLRNPFRFSFDRLTGDLYIGDVGQATREEISAVPADAPAGLNFGWDVLEGTSCFDPDPGEPACNDASLVDPIYELERPSCAIAGGSVYRGNDSPSLRGWYFFGDWCSARLIRLRWTPENGVTDVEELTDTIQKDPPGNIRQIVAVSEGGDGELYVVSLLGSVWRLVPEPGSVLSALAAMGALGALRVRRRRG